jgi:hypothetical protein
VLTAYRAVCPHVDVQVVGAAGASAITLLVEGAIDLYILTEAIGDGRVLARPLFHDEMRSWRWWPPARSSRSGGCCGPRASKGRRCCSTHPTRRA